MARPGRNRSVRATAWLSLAALLGFGFALPTVAEPVDSSQAAWPVAAPMHPVFYRSLSRDGIILEGPGNTRVRYRAERDHPTPTSPVASGRAVAEAVVAGLNQVHAWVHENLELAQPESFEVLLTDLSGHRGARYVPADLSGNASLLLVHDAPAAGLDAVRDAVAFDYVRAILTERLPGLPEPWAIGTAYYAQLATGGANPSNLPILSARIADLDRGLIDAPSAERGGHALWLAFLEENFGLQSVKASLNALAHNPRSLQALDKSLRRSAGSSLADAFREFQLWTVLSGARDDAKHFSFGAQLEEAEFAADERGLPALSVQSNPSVAPWGAAQIRLRPDEAKGGLRLLFEGGGFETRWDLDLLWNHLDGSRHRIAVELEEGRGEIAVPLEGVDSIWMLVRNLGGESGADARYTFAAHHEPDYPLEFSGLEVRRNDAEPSGVVVSWDTASEEDLVGYSVLRREGAEGSFRPIDGVWIPALGERDRPTSYRLMDREIRSDVSYEYRIQAMTRWGLVVLSPTAASPAEN